MKHPKVNRDLLKLNFKMRKVRERERGRQREKLLSKTLAWEAFSAYTCANRAIKLLKWSLKSRLHLFISGPLFSLSSRAQREDPEKEQMKNRRMRQVHKAQRTHFFGGNFFLLLWNIIYIHCTVNLIATWLGFLSLFFVNGTFVPLIVGHFVNRNICRV